MKVRTLALGLVLALAPSAFAQSNGTIEILNVRCDVNEHRFATVTGELKNDMADPWGPNIWIYLDFRDKAGVLVSEDTGVVGYNVVRSGQNSPFQGSVLGLNPDITTVDVRPHNIDAAADDPTVSGHSKATCE